MARCEWPGNVRQLMHMIERIVVLNEGRIIQTGTHDELLASGGLYKKLYEMQFR